MKGAGEPRVRVCSRKNFGGQDGNDAFILGYVDLEASCEMSDGWLVMSAESLRSIRHDTSYHEWLRMQEF